MKHQRIKIGYVGCEIIYWIIRSTHCFIAGKSGEGKSVLVILMWLQDHLAGYAKILIDASNSLAREAYNACKGNAHYCSRESPINLNPLMSDYNPDVIVSICTEILNEACNPDKHKEGANKDITVKMFEHFDEAIKKALRNNRPSLLAVKDYLVNAKGNSEAREGLIHRLNFVLSDEEVNKIICGTDKPLRYGELIDKKQTLILDTHGMSREKMVFCGNLVTQGIKNYFRFEKRKTYNPVSIYVDECHNFLNPYWFDILKEGRKYNVSAILSTQDFSLLSETMRRILLNSGTLVAFRSGHVEATALAKEMDCKPQDIQFIDKYHCAYLTAEKRGFCRVPRPPILKEYPIKKVHAPAPKPVWFEYVSYQRADTP